MRALRRLLPVTLALAVSGALLTPGDDGPAAAEGSRSSAPAAVSADVDTVASPSSGRATVPVALRKQDERLPLGSVVVDDGGDEVLPEAMRGRAAVRALGGQAVDGLGLLPQQPAAVPHHQVGSAGDRDAGPSGRVVVMPSPA